MCKSFDTGHLWGEINLINTFFFRLGVFERFEISRGQFFFYLVRSPKTPKQALGKTSLGDRWWIKRFHFDTLLSNTDSIFNIVDQYRFTVVWCESGGRGGAVITFYRCRVKDVVACYCFSRARRRRRLAKCSLSMTFSRKMHEPPTYRAHRDHIRNT